jgi:hypothetical protein
MSRELSTSQVEIEIDWTPTMVGIVFRTIEGEHDLVKTFDNVMQVTDKIWEDGYSGSVVIATKDGRTTQIREPFLYTVEKDRGREFWNSLIDGGWAVSVKDEVVIA